MNTIEVDRVSQYPDGNNTQTQAEERGEAQETTLAIESGTPPNSIPTISLGVENDPLPITH